MIYIHIYEHSFQIQLIPIINPCVFILNQFHDVWTNAE